MFEYNLGICLRLRQGPLRGSHLKVAQVHPNKMHSLSEFHKRLSGLELLNLERSEISAVTHVDGSARLQTIHKETNPIFHALVSEFKKKTGCPVVVNTSFNVRGEPIVESPEDAFRCFMGTELDLLVLGDCVLFKDKQDQDLKRDYKDQFELD